MEKERVEADQSPGPRALSLPVVAGTDDERSALRSIHAYAVACGLTEARLFGCAGGGRVGEADALHAAAGGVVLMVALLSPPIAAGLLAVLVLSGAARALGADGLGRLVPRRPSWTVLLTVPQPGTRRALVAMVDRARPDLALRRVVAALLGLSLAATALGSLEVLVALTAAQVAAAGVALLWGRATARSGAPEAAACAALVELAVRRRRAGLDDVALLVTGGGAADGAGIDGALDWYGVVPARCAVTVVTGAPGPRVGPFPPVPLWRPASAAVAGWGWARALSRRGYTVGRIGGDPGIEAASAAELVRALGAAGWGGGTDHALVGGGALAHERSDG